MASFSATVGDFLPDRTCFCTLQLSSSSIAGVSLQDGDSLVHFRCDLIASLTNEISSRSVYLSGKFLSPSAASSSEATLRMNGLLAAKLGLRVGTNVRLSLISVPSRTVHMFC